MATTSITWKHYTSRICSKKITTEGDEYLASCLKFAWFSQRGGVTKKLVRLINEIVLGEESDIDHLGGVSDHFTLYLLAMQEVGMKTDSIEEILRTRNFATLRPAISEFVQFNLDLAHSRKAHLIAGAFFFGREKLIPDMFTGLLTNLRSQKNLYPALEYYLERHIHLDGEEHSHLAQDCLLELCGSDSMLYKEALTTGIRSLELRIKLWDDVEKLISKN